MKITYKTAPAAGYATVVLKGEKGTHRLVEKADGQLELHIGATPEKKWTARSFIVLIREIVQIANQHKLPKLYWPLDLETAARQTKHDRAWALSTLAENLLIANYSFDRYKSVTKSRLQEVALGNVSSQEDKVAVTRGLTIGAYVNTARDIANTPGDDMTPAIFAKTIAALAKGTKVNVTVFDEARIKKERLHALWAVGKGADDMPRFVIMEYRGGKPGERPIVLIGKGVTYDTGGLNIKPSGSMHDMHMDMSGGSSVALATLLAGKLKLRKNIVTLIPVAENAISEKSMRAGDIINSHSGKTIEVLHTDAEGRLILADALSYAAAYKPRAILDVATLTGAALVALGQQASAVMTTNMTLQETLCELGEESGDYVWPLPLWDEYKAPLTKTLADVVNIHPNFSKFGGAIEGAAFLSFFAPKDIPWAHLDIAPRMDAAPHDKLAKGSTGEPIRLLIKFLETF